VEFRFLRGTNIESAKKDTAYFCMLRILREAGFGFEELALTVSRDVLNGVFLVRPLPEICR
jgi:hypothetical protein